MKIWKNPRQVTTLIHDQWDQEILEDIVYSTKSNVRAFVGKIAEELKEDSNIFLDTSRWDDKDYEKIKRAAIDQLETVKAYHQVL